VKRLVALPILALAFTGSAGAALVNGTSGPDMLVGTARADTIYGYAGADVLRGRGGQDILRGGRGNDKLYAHYYRFDIVRCGRGHNDFAYVDWGLDDVRGCETGIA
jgi:Ca2+-binding RTX toxin-like protein